MRDKIYGTVIQGIGKISAGNLFDLYFLWKIKNPPSSCRTGPARGYYPDPTKSIMIMHKKILKWEDYLARVVGLGFAWVYVILVVILGMTNP